MSQQLPSMPLVAHLRELRSRVIRMLLALVICFTVLWFFASDLYLYLARPLTSLLEPIGGAELIAIGVASPFLVPLKLTLVLAFLLCLPYLLHQFWGFIAPGMYQNEQKLAIPLLLSSLILFYCGIAFSYFLVLPLIFGFFTSVIPAGILLMPDINNHLNFSLKIMFAFGVAFEIPVATYLLIASKAVSRQTLASKRPYVFVGCFAIGMMITPPDVFSQSLLAIPMYLLFELGLIFSRWWLKDDAHPTEDSGE